MLTNNNSTLNTVKNFVKNYESLVVMVEDKDYTIPMIAHNAVIDRTWFSRQYWLDNTSSTLYFFLNTIKNIENLAPKLLVAYINLAKVLWEEKNAIYTKPFNIAGGNYKYLNKLFLHTLMLSESNITPVFSETKTVSQEKNLTFLKHLSNLFIKTTAKTFVASPSNARLFFCKLLNKPIVFAAYNYTEYLDSLRRLKQQITKNMMKKASVVAPYPYYNSVPMKNNKAIYLPYAHQFHILSPSPWPLFVAFSLWLTMLSTVAVFHKFNGAGFDALFGLICLITAAGFWWRDVIRESTYEFKHTPTVRQGLLLGVALFILSEAFLFFGFFWAFFNSSLVPSAYIGGIWPPIFIVPINPWKLPLLNTLILIMSGFTVTLAHRHLKYVPYFDTHTRYIRIHNMLLWLGVTIVLALLFLFCQAFEYYYASFSFYDTVYGTTFYSLTSLHGSHVLVGTIFLTVCLWRASSLHFTSWKQVGFKSAVWYWHFVDIVWILLFFTVYIWGGSSTGLVLMEIAPNSIVDVATVH